MIIKAKYLLFMFFIVSCWTAHSAESDPALESSDSELSLTESLSENDTSGNEPSSKTDEIDASQPTQEENTNPQAKTANEANDDLSDDSESWNGQDDYQQPLMFNPKDNGLQLVDPQLKWHMKNGETIDVNGLNIHARSIHVELTQAPRDQTPVSLKNEENASPIVQILSIRWPTLLTSTGLLTIESSRGKKLWSLPITMEMRRYWQSLIKSTDPDTKKILSPHNRSSFGWADTPDSIMTLLKKWKVVRFCLSHEKDKSSKIKICTTPFQLKVQGEKIELQRKRPSTQPTAYIGKLNVGSHGIANLPLTRPYVFRILFQNNSSIAIASLPIDLKLIDAVLNDKENEIILTGEGDRPLGHLRTFNHPESHFWAATGIKKEPVWQKSLPKESPLLRVTSAYKIPFTLLFKFDHLPREENRVYIEKSPSNGTYSSHPLLFGYTPFESSVSSEELSAQTTEHNQFIWEFSAPESGNDNRSRLIVTDKSDPERKWITSETLYRGYPFETSMRLTGVATANAQVVVLGELAAQAWFETLFGMRNGYLSRQRWGIASRYFKALSSFELENGEAVSELSSLNVDLKYNLYRGIWNRDELFGLIASYENISISGKATGLLGFGAYWARTMPKIFDDLFNLVPLMRYPKYVDMEFIYYPVASDSSIQAGSSYNLNFHGKVFWTKQFYGEAGFGLKSFEFTNNSTSVVNSFAMAYGTIGLGVMF